VLMQGAERGGDHAVSDGAHDALRRFALRQRPSMP
jgi:hypothetical protein